LAVEVHVQLAELEDLTARVQQRLALVIREAELAGEALQRDVPDLALLSLDPEGGRRPVEAAVGLVLELVLQRGAVGVRGPPGRGDRALAADGRSGPDTSGQG